MSVIIYYINFIFNSLGNNGKIPAMASTLIPIICLSIISIMGLIRINENNIIIFFYFYNSLYEFICKEFVFKTSEIKYLKTVS